MMNTMRRYRPLIAIAALLLVGSLAVLAAPSGDAPTPNAAQSALQWHPRLDAECRGVVLAEPSRARAPDTTKRPRMSAIQAAPGAFRRVMVRV